MTAHGSACSTTRSPASGAGVSLSNQTPNDGAAPSVGAFSLIELLVVIAIIAVLASLLLPALVGAKKDGQSAACKNHLREMGMALRMYVNDTGFYPYYAQNVPGNWQALRWQTEIAPYYPLNWTNPAYHCPGYQGVISSVNGGTWYSLGSYSYNLYGASLFDTEAPLASVNVILPEKSLGLGQERVYGGICPPHREAEIVAPGELYAMMDTSAFFPAPATNNYYVEEGTPPPVSAGPGFSGFDAAWCANWYGSGATGQGQSGALIGAAPDLFMTKYKQPHGEVFNVLCCDGHVSGVPWKVLLNPTNSASHWNVDHKPHPEFWVENWAPP